MESQKQSGWQVFGSYMPFGGSTGNTSQHAVALSSPERTGSPSRSDLKAIGKTGFAAKQRWPMRQPRGTMLQDEKTLDEISIAIESKSKNSADEIESIVRKLLDEFQQRIHNHIDQKLAELEGKHRILEEQVRRLHGFPGLPPPQPTLARDASTSSAQALQELEKLNHESLDCSLSKLHGNQHAQVQALEKELACIREGTSPIPSEQHVDGRSDREAELVAQIRKLQNRPMTVSESSALLALPVGDQASQLQSGIMDQLTHFEQSRRYWEDRKSRGRASV